MKKEIHKAETRGKSDISWLHSRFSFSFANYHNPNKMGFGKLRVLNDDVIEPSKGFGSHPHDNMEIITILTEGELIHKDSTGVEEVLAPGKIQVMSAGSGIVHSEYNNSKTDKLKLFQIWIDAKKQDIKPSHDKKTFNLNKNS
ncbi:MAG: pirin family protein [Nanoarchaeota archaeon]